MNSQCGVSQPWIATQATTGLNGTARAAGGGQRSAAATPVIPVPPQSVWF
jgi:hypothetical protein